MFDKFCEENGIIHETTPPYSPQYNGVAEYKNITLKNMVISMLDTSGLPFNMWGEALLTACYILNKIPFKKLDKTPYELWKNRQLCFKHLKVWGCLAKVAILLPKRTKLGPKTIDCVFIGYAKNSNTYRFLVVESKNPYIDKNNILESRDAEFFETKFPFKERSEASYNITPRIRDDTLEWEESENRVSKRPKTSTSFGPNLVTYLVEDDPTTFVEAMSSTDFVLWKEVVNSEIEYIISNVT